MEEGRGKEEGEVIVVTQLGEEVGGTLQKNPDSSFGLK